MSKLDVSQQQSVVELARNGNFRALAYWLNSQLVPQGIYVQVQAARPGCLQTVVEFHRPPLRDRLVRYICHRLWQLESDLIEGVHILARYVGQSDFIWQQTIRIPTRAERRQRRQDPQTVDVKARSAHIPPKINTSSSAKWLTLNFSSPQQLKMVRSFMLSGSAIAAFLMGFWLEHLTTRPSPTLPVISKTNPTARVASNRPSMVQAALETVAVLQHEDVKNPYDPSITLMFSGEVSPADLNIGAAENVGGLLAELDATQSADLSMVSLAEPLANAATSLEEELYDRSRSDSAEALRQSGIDIVNLADDQIVDYGEAGLLETIKSLDQAGVYRMGAGRDVREARRPEIIDVKGQRVAYLGYSGADWLAAGRGSAGINPQEQTTVAEDIKAIRDQVDWIVVSYRWSEELSADQVEDWQKDMARFAIDQGADLVVGQHPDVLQGAEVYKGRPIAYSLGDLILEDDPYAEFDTAVLKVSLKPEQMKVEFVPVAVKDGHPQLAKGRHGQEILDQIAKSSEAFEQPLKIPMVLDLRQPDVAPERPVDPNAPFVDPDAPELEILNPDTVDDGTTQKQEADDSTELQSPLKDDKLEAAPTDEWVPADDSPDKVPASGPKYFGDPNLTVDDQSTAPDTASDAVPSELDDSKLKHSDVEEPELGESELDGWEPDAAGQGDLELENSKTKELDTPDSESHPSNINPFNPFNSLDRNAPDAVPSPEPEAIDLDSYQPGQFDNDGNQDVNQDVNQTNFDAPTLDGMGPDPSTSGNSSSSSSDTFDTDAMAPEIAPGINSEELHSEEYDSPVETEMPAAEPVPGVNADVPGDGPAANPIAPDANEKPDASGAIEPVEEPLVGPLVNRPSEPNAVATLPNAESTESTSSAESVEAAAPPSQDAPHELTDEGATAIALDQFEVAINTEMAHFNANSDSAEPKLKAPATELNLPQVTQPQLPNLPTSQAKTTTTHTAPVISPDANPEP